MLETHRMRKNSIPTRPLINNQKTNSNRRATIDKTGINTKGTNIQVVLRCKGNHSIEPKSITSSILEFIQPNNKSDESNSKGSNTNSNTNNGSTDNGSTDNGNSDSMGSSNRNTARKPITEVLLNTNNTIYSFDHVFKPEDTQDTIYREVAEPILNDVLAGYSCTIFAYGQTGTGKTYTMEGDLSESETGHAINAGIIPRTIHDLFNKITGEHHITVSMLELYNEELRDLLCASDDQRPLKIYEEKDGTGAKVHCQEHPITSVSQGLEIMKAGVRKRMTAATNCNEKSSRSHCIFTITVYMDKKTSTGEDVYSVGKLNLVDLAGSENNRSSGSENLRAREAASINRSLLTLGRVINCLVDKTPHIPYRESKLTRILKDSLGGHTKTCIIATVAPDIQHQEEIRSTLDYASHAKGICNKPQSNANINRERHVDTLVRTIEQLYEELRVNYEKNGVYQTKRSYDQMKHEMQMMKNEINIQKEENERLKLAERKAKEDAAFAVEQVKAKLSTAENALVQAKIAKDEMETKHADTLQKMTLEYKQGLSKLESNYKAREQALKEEFELKEAKIKNQVNISMQEHNESIEIMKQFRDKYTQVMQAKWDELFSDIQKKRTCSSPQATQNQHVSSTPKTQTPPKATLPSNIPTAVRSSTSPPRSNTLNNHTTTAANHNTTAATTVNTNNHTTNTTNTTFTANNTTNTMHNTTNTLASKRKQAPVANNGSWLKNNKRLKKNHV